MTWEIVVGIIALVGLIGTFVGAAWKVSNTLATLNATINSLQKTLDEFRNDNKASHGEIYNKLNDHDRRLASLEAIRE